MAQILTMGEALVEIMRPETGQPLDQEGIFQGPFASGAPAIFAVAMARLGISAAFLGCVGEDAFGRLLRRRFEAEGVDITGLIRVEGRSTAVAFVAYNLDGQREFVFHLRHAAAGELTPQMIEPAWFHQARWLHLSGSTLALNQNCQEAAWQAVELVKAGGGKVSFDPNLRPELMPIHEARQVIAPFMHTADLLLPTSEEARLLAGKEHEIEAIEYLTTLGSSLVAVKRGVAGCSLYTSEIHVDCPGFPIDELDPTGAGDCFNAGMIYALEAGWTLEKAGRFACAAGALAVTRQGPMEGAPKLAEVLALCEHGVQS